MLTLGWSDGYSFVPVGFNMLSSAKQTNRYQEISDKIDHRTNGYKARKESLLSKPEAAILLIQHALRVGSAKTLSLDSYRPKIICFPFFNYVSLFFHLQFSHELLCQ